MSEDDKRIDAVVPTEQLPEFIRKLKEYAEGAGVQILGPYGDEGTEPIEDPEPESHPLSQTAEMPTLEQMTGQHDYTICSMHRSTRSRMGTVMGWAALGEERGPWWVTTQLVVRADLEHWHYETDVLCQGCKEFAENTDMTTERGGLWCLMLTFQQLVVPEPDHTVSHAQAEAFLEVLRAAQRG